MSIKASEISDLIKARIDKFQSANEARNVGTVTSVTDGIVRIHGLADARYGEMLEFVDNTIDVEVTSAVELNAAQADKLKQALSKRLKRQVRMQTSVDPALVGGAVVRAGDLVIDGSLKGRLERLATELGS